MRVVRELKRCVRERRVCEEKINLERSPFSFFFPLILSIQQIRKNEEERRRRKNIKKMDTCHSMNR
jgi:hypothetical protein